MSRLAGVWGVDLIWISQISFTNCLMIKFNYEWQFNYVLVNQISNQM